MLKKLILVMILFNILFQFNISSADLYCPEDGGACYDLAPLPDINTSSPGNSTTTTSNSTSSSNLKTSMLPTTDTVLATSTGEGFDPLNSVIKYVKNFIFTFLGITVIGVFIYFGYRMVSSRGNPEELKKTINGFVYVVIGLAIISLAWAVIRLVTTLSF